VSYALIRTSWLDLGAFARASGTHPELIRRLVALGLLDARQDADGELWLPRSELAMLGRVQRLRAGFALNYAAVGLVADLLDRIATLEEALRSSARQQTAPGARRPGG
jgi:chaperone modulatory protein CbpM